MDREKQLTRALRTKCFQRVKAWGTHIYSTDGDGITHTRMAKDAATGDVVLLHFDIPFGNENQRQGERWSRHTVDHHANRHGTLRGVGKSKGFQGRPVVVQLVIVTDRHRVAIYVHQEEIVVRSIGGAVEWIGPLQKDAHLSTRVKEHLQPGISAAKVVQMNTGIASVRGELVEEPLVVSEGIVPRRGNVYHALGHSLAHCLGYRSLLEDWFIG